MIYPITVVNKHHGAKGEYIGRGSPLGNPFPLGNYLTREGCIEDYKEHILYEIDKRNEIIINELYRLHRIAEKEPLNLVCFCAPKQCHGDIVKQILMGEL